jgi:hypothetical protein
MGNLSENRMRNIVTDESTSLWQELREVRTLLEQERARHNQNQPRGAVDSAVTAPDKYKRWMARGFFRRVPEDWVFPMGPVLNVFQYWHHGNEQREISPLKKLNRSDLSWAKGDKTCHPCSVRPQVGRDLLRPLSLAVEEQRPRELLDSADPCLTFAVLAVSVYACKSQALAFYATILRPFV